MNRNWKQNVWTLLLGTSLIAFANVGDAGPTGKKSPPKATSNKPLLKAKVSVSAKKAPAKFPVMIPPRPRAAPGVVSKKPAGPGARTSWKPPVNGTAPKNLSTANGSTLRVATAPQSKTAPDAVAKRKKKGNAAKGNTSSQSPSTTKATEKGKGNGGSTAAMKLTIVDDVYIWEEPDGAMDVIRVSGNERNERKATERLQILPDGSKTYRNKDGTVLKIDSDGRTVSAPSKPKMVSDIFLGRELTSVLDNKKDGLRTGVFDDGTFLIFNDKDNTMTVDKPNGLTDHYDKDGRLIATTGIAVSRQILDPSNPGFYTDGKPVGSLPGGNKLPGVGKGRTPELPGTGRGSFDLGGKKGDKRPDGSVGADGRPLKDFKSVEDLVSQFGNANNSQNSGNNSSSGDSGSDSNSGSSGTDSNSGSGQGNGSDDSDSTSPRSSFPDDDAPPDDQGAYDNTDSDDDDDDDDDDSGGSGGSGDSGGDSGGGSDSGGSAGGQPPPEGLDFSDVDVNAEPSTGGTKGDPDGDGKEPAPGESGDDADDGSSGGSDDDDDDSANTDSQSNVGFTPSDPDQAPVRRDPATTAALGRALRGRLFGRNGTNSTPTDDDSGGSGKGDAFTENVDPAKAIRSKLNLIGRPRDDKREAPAIDVGSHPGIGPDQNQILPPPDADVPQQSGNAGAPIVNKSDNLGGDGSVQQQSGSGGQSPSRPNTSGQSNSSSTSTLRMLKSSTSKSAATKWSAILKSLKMQQPSRVPTDLPPSG